MLILGLATRLGAAAILGTMSVAIYHAIATSGFNIYLLELIALYFGAAFSIILLGPGMFSADYLLTEIVETKTNFLHSVFNQKIFNHAPSSNEQISKPISQNKLFEFPFSSFLS